MWPSWGLKFARTVSFSFYDINNCVIFNTFQVGNSGKRRGVFNFPIYSTEISWYKIYFISMREVRFSLYREFTFFGVCGVSLV